MRKTKPEISAELNNPRAVTIVLFLSGLAVISSLYITIPMHPHIAADYQLSANQAAWAGSIFSIFFAVGCLFFTLGNYKILARSGFNVAKILMSQV